VRVPTRTRTRSVWPRLAAIVAAVALAVTGIAAVARLGDDTPGGVATIAPPPGGDGEALTDPFAWDPDRAEDFERRAAAGSSHLLYRLAPGGVLASAERTARWRPLIDKAADEAGVDADTLEGLVFLESAGRDDAITPAGIEGAVGLTQILAGTATDLLGMKADTRASARLGRRIARARSPRHIEMLRRARAAADQRFDGRASLAGTARYLKLAKDTFGRDDLAFVSYHMGIGNLQGVLAAYGEDEPSYAELYFGSTPVSHPVAHKKLLGLGDDSSNYYWKVLAGREIMRLYRDDRTELQRLTALHSAKSSAEEVLHPNGSETRYGDPELLRDAWDRDEIVAFPDTPAVTGLRRDPRMGELAGRLDQPAGQYRGLRPEALALAMYIGAQTRALSGRAPLIVTSTVRDEAYQRQLVSRNREATRNYSLHTTGWAFDVERRYVSREQALAFQFLLDRLQTLNVIAWAREPDAIHITVSRDAKVLLPLLDRLQPAP
jgi:soluble lytic murein transglycosylase-like protein